jgi:polar amino acid transport system substrate-binding protein
MNSKRLVLFVLLAAAAAFSATASDKVIRLTSLEWPPYSGAKVDQQGASVAVVRAAAEAMGYTLEVKFFPWNRAVAMAQDGASGFHGYFPEYHSDDVASSFVLSDPIGSGPLGFVEASAAPVAWSSLADLKGKAVGTVDGYVNTAEFDALTAKGEIKAEAVSDDLTNIKKVGAGRIGLAVIDRNVMNYLLGTDASLAPMKGKVQFNARLLEDKALYIAFQKSPKGEEAAKVINEGLKKIDAAAIAAKFFQ